jgi:hypothetical protein
MQAVPQDHRGSSEHALGNPPIPETGGAESGVPRDGSQQSDGRINDDLAAALVLIADLPLTKDEKADAVRRLLGRSG